MTGTAPPAGTETITRDELAEALRGLKITPEDENMFYPAVADAIFEKARRNSEPEYEPGSLYVCARGDAWQFIGGEWETPGVSGSVPFAVPQRPLRKLVPEGSQAAGLNLEAVRHAVNLGILCNETPIEIARRIGKLLEADHERR